MFSVVSTAYWRFMDGPNECQRMRFDCAAKCDFVCAMPNYTLFHFLPIQIESEIGQSVYTWKMDFYMPLVPERILPFGCRAVVAPHFTAKNRKFISLHFQKSVGPYRFSGLSLAQFMILLPLHERNHLSIVMCSRR